MDCLAVAPERCCDLEKLSAAATWMLLVREVVVEMMSDGGAVLLLMMVVLEGAGGELKWMETLMAVRLLWFAVA